MKFGLSGLLFPHTDIEKAILTIGELGADHAELIFDLPNFTPEFGLGKIPRLRKLVDSQGLDISIHGPIWDLNPNSWHTIVRRLALKYMQKSIDLCSALGGEIVVVHPGRCPFPQEERFLKPAQERFLNFIKSSLNYAKNRGVKLTLENFPISTEFPYSSPREMLSLVKKFDGLGITFDVGHAFLNKTLQKLSSPERRIGAEIKMIRKYIINIHFHDNRGERDEHLPPGDGRINFRPIVRAIRDIGYLGWITIELHKTGTKDPAEIGRAGLEKTRELFKT
ncbi:MAG: sugar phosphate isomerase/epimerase family protein [Candidatus Hadarchaeaceae archaeon]